MHYHASIKISVQPNECNETYSSWKNKHTQIKWNYHSELNISGKPLNCGRSTFKDKINLQIQVHPQPALTNHAETSGYCCRSQSNVDALGLQQKVFSGWQKPKYFTHLWHPRPSGKPNFSPVPRDKSGLLCVYGSQNVALQPAASASSRSIKHTGILSPHPKPTEFKFWSPDQCLVFLRLCRELRGIQVWETLL